MSTILTQTSINALIVLALLVVGTIVVSVIIAIVDKQDKRTVEHIVIGQRLAKHYEDEYAKSKLN